LQAGNANFSSLASPDGVFIQTAFSANSEHNLGRGLCGYWEILGYTLWGQAGSAAWFANTGITVPRQECELMCG